MGFVHYGVILFVVWMWNRREPLTPDSTDMSGCSKGFVPCMILWPLIVPTLIYEKLKRRKDP